MVKVKLHRKWYIQGEADERKQNLATVTVGHFSLEKRRLKTAQKQAENGQSRRHISGLKLKRGPFGLSETPAGCKIF